MYASYLSSAYFEYITESFYLWQLTYVLFILTILVFDKTFFLQKKVVFFLAYLLSIYCLSVFLGGTSFSIQSAVRLFQYMFSLIFFLYILFLLRDPEYLDLYYKYLSKIFKIVVVFIPIQIILRIVYFPASLSDHQYFRSFGNGMHATTSVFYEARGLTQFLIVFLFYFLFVYQGPKKAVGVFCCIIGILSTFSLSGTILLIFLIGLYLLLKIKLFISPKYFVSVVILSITIIGLVSNTHYVQNASNRMVGMYENFKNVKFIVMLENGWKLNHVDHYAQYSDEFIEQYGFHGGSESVSTVAEASYLYQLIKNFDFVLGKSPAVKERYVTLNAIVDTIARIGLVGAIILLVYVNKLIRYNRYIILIFLSIFFAIDGATPKPQIPFLVGTMVILTHFKKKSDDFFNPTSVQSS